MKITYKQMVGMGFNMAMQKLMSTPMKPKHAKQIKTIGMAIDSAREPVADSMDKEIIEIYAKRDSKKKIN